MTPLSLHNRIIDLYFKIRAGAPAHGDDSARAGGGDGDGGGDGARGERGVVVGRERAAVAARLAHAAPRHHQVAPLYNYILLLSKIRVPAHCHISFAFNKSIQQRR